MLWKTTQHSWKGGQFDRSLMGRSDLAKYPESATKIENFIVKRQGCLAKRRGSEEVCDLKNLLGGSTQPGKVRLLPLVYEKDEGYYVILTRGRAFLAGANGIRLMDGSWAKRIDPYDFTDYNPDPEDTGGYAGSKPYSVRSFGYDTLQEAFNGCISGDTVYVHEDGLEFAPVTLTQGYPVALDLNGHALKCSGTASAVTLAAAGCSLTVRNTGATTYVDATGNEQPVDIRHNASRNVDVVTVTSGKLVLGTGGAVYGTGASSVGVYVAAAGTVVVDGGQIEAGGDGIEAQSGAKVTVEGGRIESRGSYVVEGGSSAQRLVVRGGTFKGVYGCRSYTDIYGGKWSVSGRFGYSNVAIYGGRFKLAAADFYYTKFPVYRGEFLAGNLSAELLAALAQGGAVANRVTTYERADGTYAGYRQPDEADYSYDGTPWTATARTANAAASVTVSDEDSRKPFYVNVPYSDDDLAEIDCTQSGDILFLAHRDYPFASLSFVGQGLAYEVRTFSNEHWKRPTVTSVAAAAGSEFPTEGAYKTVYYCCTYVKDGVESLPSQPYPFKYRLPWPDTAAVVISVAKGQNDDEPDAYNIYKKESTDYGLVGTISMDLEVAARPDVASTKQLTKLVRQGRAWGPEAGRTVTMQAQNVEWYLNREGDPLILGTFANGSEGWGYRGIGGVRSKGALVFDFGSRSNVVISRIKLALDAHEFVTVEEPECIGVCDEYGWCSERETNKKYVNHFSGRYFAVTLKTMDGAGTVRTFSKSVAVDAQPFYETSGSGKKAVVTRRQLVPGSNETFFPTFYGLDGSVTTDGQSYRHGIAEVDEYARTLDVDFTAELQSAYPNDGGDSSGGSKTNFSVCSIQVTAYATQGGSTCDVYWHGVKFRNAYGASDSYEDEYVAPDLSISPPESRDHFSSGGQYPGCAAICQQRLCLAASREQPNGFWMSCVGDLFNFDVHSSLREDDAISAEVAATEFPQVNHMVMSKNLMLFGDAAEWEVAPSTGTTLSYKTVSAKVQSTIGCIKTLKPITVGDEILFVEQNGRTVRSIRYNFVSDGYESTDLSVLSQDLTRSSPIVQMAYQQNPDSLVWCVLEDGTLAVLVYMKEHEMVAWSHQTLGGGFKARGVATSKALSNGTTDVMLLVERGGAYRLWRLRDDVATATAKAQVAMDGIVSGETDDDRTAVSVGGSEVSSGYPFVSELVTVRPEGNEKATTQFERQNATELEVQVIDGSAFSVRAYGQDANAARKVQLPLSIGADGNVALADAMAKKTLAGTNSRDGRIVLTHSEPWPLVILSLTTTYQIELENRTGGDNED